jgi:hypothetical protein
MNRSTSVGLGEGIHSVVDIPDNAMGGMRNRSPCSSIAVRVLETLEISMKSGTHWLWVIYVGRESPMI